MEKKFPFVPSIKGAEELMQKCRLEVVQQPVRARMCGFGDKVCRTSFSFLVKVQG